MENTDGFTSLSQEEKLFLSQEDPFEIEDVQHGRCPKPYTQTLNPKP
jgi:hypothetical protein